MRYPFFCAISCSFFSPRHHAWHQLKLISSSLTTFYRPRSTSAALWSSFREFPRYFRGASERFQEPRGRWLMHLPGQRRRPRRIKIDKSRILSNFPGMQYVEKAPGARIHESRRSAPVPGCSWKIAAVVLKCNLQNDSRKREYEVKAWFETERAF